MKNFLHGNAMVVMIWHCSRSIRGVDMILYYCDQISSFRIHCNEFVFINAPFYSSCFNEFHFYIISYHIMFCCQFVPQFYAFQSQLNTFYYDPSALTTPLFSPTCCYSMHLSICLSILLSHSFSLTFPLSVCSYIIFLNHYLSFTSISQIQRSNAR